MRRIRRRKKNKKIPILFAVLLLLFVSSGYALLNSKLNINGFASLSFFDNDKCEFNVSATYNNDYTWGGENNTVYYHVILTISNNDTKDITDWVMEIKGPSDLDVMANANVVSNENGILTLTPYSWNSYIGVGNSLAFDMALITTQKDFKPDWIKFNDCVIYGDVTNNDDSSDEDPESISLALVPDSYTMDVGESMTLQTNIMYYSNNLDIEWTSGNSDVAVVDSNGKVTAVGEGKTKVTATIEGVSASSEITVNNNDTNDIDIKFAVTNSWGSSIQYKINITNNSISNINGCSFGLGMPNGSLYTIWSSNTYANSNTISCNNKIVSGNSYDIYGQVDLPSGYNINNYLNPSISNITIK